MTNIWSYTQMYIHRLGSLQDTETQNSRWFCQKKTKTKKNGSPQTWLKTDPVLVNKKRKGFLVDFGFSAVHRIKVKESLLYRVIGCN